MAKHDHHAQHGNAHQHGHHDHGGGSLGVAVSATLHCLTGCAIGEVAGMAIGTALGFSDLATIALAVALAFLFGYALTSLPLLRAGLSLSAVIPIALASDTFSIAVMEIVDNAVMLLIPGALHAGLDSTLFWGALAFALAVAFVAAVPVNRWLIERGKGHAVVHETGVHGGPPIRVVAAVTIAMAVFGTAVLGAEAISGGSEDAAHDSAAGDHDPAGGEHGGDAGGDGAAGGSRDVRGLSPVANGVRMNVDRGRLPAGDSTRLTFTIEEGDGPVRKFDVAHSKRMHLIVVRRDMRGFQHLHPRMGRRGTWSTPIRFREPGHYRVFADFVRDGKPYTLAASIVAGDAPAPPEPLPPPARTARAGVYEVALAEMSPRAGAEADLGFVVTSRGRPVALEPHLGASGHLVALRERDLAYLHVHPIEDRLAARRGHARFGAKFASAARYRLFFQFKHGGRVHTAEFTREAR